jgi:hypothetical protein
VNREASPVVIDDQSNDTHRCNSSLPLFTDQNEVKYHHVVAACLILTGKELFPKVLAAHCVKYAVKQPSTMDEQLPQVTIKRKLLLM